MRTALRAPLNCWLISLLLCMASTLALAVDAPKAPPPDTGISGVYEVMVGADQFAPDLGKPDSRGYANEAAIVQHFELFGFKEIQRASLSASQAERIYGVDSALTAIRMQNGGIDSHGLLRVLVWAKPIGPGVGYAPPETIGQRLAVMMTADIIRTDDVFNDARAAAQAWLPIAPVFADLFKLTTGTPDLQNRRIGVRESGVYGEWFNHVFFQRYDYTIPGYGTVNPNSALLGSEFTHHDFMIATDIKKSTDYYQDLLGFKAENDGVLDGDWLEGPKKVFGMPDGGSHYYRGFVSPNNICGKLKFFAPRDVRADRARHQRVGELGITLHSLYTDKLDALYAAVKRSKLKPSALQENEFGERSFVFTGPDGATWQILALKTPPKNAAVTELKIVKTP
jgi:catechol 2,3-dioxygenase-like lactoylglutathione lyase family enzyme